MKKLTKIVATISDRRCDVSFIQSLYDAGMNVVRLNTAHMNTEGALRVIENARKVSDKIAFLLDTKGPEIRTTVVEKDLILNKGDKIYIKGDKDGVTSDDCICTTYNNFVHEIPVGSQILIADGELELEVIAKNNEKLECIVNNDGVLGSRKNINVPGIEINLPSLNPKDLEFINFAIENDVTFIAHSFVRNKEDVLAIQKILDERKSPVKIIAKIENQQGFDNIDEILENVYGIMVARGDLGLEVPVERIPAIQKELNRKCILMRKPVIVATQMLHSMIENPRPTRAEVSDVANAIYDGADAVMLSGETASGQYPVEAVTTMTKIALEVERIKKNYKDSVNLSHDGEITAFLAKSAVKASITLDAKAIITDTITGKTVRQIAAFRGNKPIYAMCYNDRALKELALSYGVYPETLEQRKVTDEFFHRAISLLIEKGYCCLDDLLIVIAGNFGPGVGASFIEISKAENLLKRFI